YNAAGQVHVSDNVNGPWTRSVSTTWSGTGDIALFYRENSAPAPSGLVVTVSASASAYLQEAFADFRGVATVGALDQAVIAQGQGTYASVGPTGPVPAGELVRAAGDFHRDGEGEDRRRGHPDRHGDVQGRPERARHRHPERRGPGDVRDQHARGRRAPDHRVLRRRRNLQRQHFEHAHPDGEE